MYIPEWEVERTIVWNPSLIEIPGKLEGLKLVERQKYLKNLGRYIDLLFKNRDKYAIVEVKCNYIDDTSIVTEQVLEYRKGLARELRVQEEKIVCILTSPKGFSNKVKTLCNKSSVLTVKIDESEIVNIIPKLSESSKFTLFSDFNKTIYQKILRNRGIFISTKELNNLNEEIIDEIKSVRTWIKQGVHDAFAKKKIAALFKEISENSPICAHEIGMNTNGKLTNNYDTWFWLFYSVMDRRSNAANFIKAKTALEKKGLFRPQKITQLINRKNEAFVIYTIVKILEESGFPLMHDSVTGKEAQPKSIVNAAKFIQKYSYDFNKLYDYHFEKNKGDYEATYKSIRDDLQSSIYGVGPRIASQFIRGMVLKGNWNLPLKDDLLLEKCQFNVRFASPLRLSLVDSNDTYYEELGKFADDYLEGNRAIISHALWYTRKRYCDKKIKCKECKLSGYCKYSYKTILEPTINENATLEEFGN